MVFLFVDNFVSENVVGELLADSNGIQVSDHTEFVDAGHTGGGDFQVSIAAQKILQGRHWRRVDDGNQDFVFERCFQVLAGVNVHAESKFIVDVICKVFFRDYQTLIEYHGILENIFRYLSQACFTDVLWFFSGRISRDNGSLTYRPFVIGFAFFRIGSMGSEHEVDIRVLEVAFFVR